VPDVDEVDWARLVDQVSNGDCTPFLGAGACRGTLPVGAELSEAWAADHMYPLADRHDLPRVMQYVAIRTRDAVSVKQRLARNLGGLGPPNFADPAEPHGLLARLPLPVYLTTNYDDFMVRALRNAGKEPSSAICRWYRDARAADEVFTTNQGYNPRHEEPIVYHLHGSFREPRSLVLTEEDYLEFLINLALDKASDERKLIPTSIFRALTTKPLLFIGYSLQDWTFRVLFHGLLRTISEVQWRRHVSVQLSPLPEDEDPEAYRRAKDYLTAYFDRRNISLYWGTAEAFCTELRGRLGWAP
jgi:hypothetical protein